MTLLCLPSSAVGNQIIAEQCSQDDLRSCQAMAWCFKPTIRSQGAQSVLLRLQLDHDRPHDVTQLAPGDTAYAQLSVDHSSVPEAGAEQPPIGSSIADQLWEEVTILCFQHGGHAVRVAAMADASRTATVAVDDLVLTPFADDPSGSDSDAASDGGGDSDGDAPMRPVGGGASSGRHDEYQPAPAIPHDGDAELDPVSSGSSPSNTISPFLCCVANTLPCVRLQTS